MSARRKLAVIVDGMMIARWQAEALRTVADCYDLLIYNCVNPRPGRRRLGNGLYYALNLVTVRNSWTRLGSIPKDLPVVACTDFQAAYKGSWQSLPDDLLTQIREDRPSAIIKFGMGLLVVPDATEFDVPILSYHHGDPEHFRGRPAGFYELLHGAPVMGQVVQRLSNALDSGEILASAETKLFPQSYRATLIEAYRHSPLILARAVETAVAGGGSAPRQLGRNYRLPGNALVVRFLLGRLRHGAGRIVYGLFKEKHWRVATLRAAKVTELADLAKGICRTVDWQVRPTPPGYRFVADPFHHPDGGLLAEAFNKRSSRGEIVRLDGSDVRRLSGRGGHFSFPATVRVRNAWFVVPEVSDWSPPLAFPVDDRAEPFLLKIDGSPRLLDPTPLVHDGTLYLFGNVASEGASVLRLWVAAGLRDIFAEHPASPIRISPNGSRMAGTPCHIGGQLIRFGQDFRGGYGDGLTAFAITRLDPDGYREVPVQELRFSHCRGPHTLNFARGEALFDFYTEGFSLLAGPRRWRDRRAARRTD